MADHHDDATRREVLAKLQACLNNLSGAGGNLASIRLVPESFEIVTERPLEDGARAFETQATGYLVTEHDPAAGPGMDDAQDDARTIGTTLILDADLELTRDEAGRIRLEPYTVLDPRHWSLDDRRALPASWPEHEASDPDAWIADLLAEEGDP